jgi:cell division protease FtsH
LFLLLALGAMWGIQSWQKRESAPQSIPYSEFLTLVDGNKIAEAELRQAEVIARVKPEGDDKGRIVRSNRIPGIDETKLLDELREHKVVFSGKLVESSLWQQLVFGWLMPLLGFGLLWWIFMRRAGGGGGGALTFGKSKAKVYDASRQEPVTFTDVAGVDEAVGELVEVVDFLKNPSRYRSLGARIPKGVLLVGPPGTGKTLLARAVAGEAGVPFFSMTGSDFVEMFVGVGAARVRDLFAEAQSRAPCIVFIDEIDAIGKSRGGLGAMAMHDEREQTLNQLLAEMDGFDGQKGVIIMAATNRPEVLDPALLRAGRFDRQVLVDRPDVRGREAIVRVHARRLSLAEDVSLQVVAQRTPGMVGADLANVVNEAALAAARRGAPAVHRIDFEEAIDRLQLGLKKTGRVMNEEEKRRVAYHEAGHALVALSVQHADPVHRVTIIPRSIGALGATLQLPTEERYLMTREELRDRLAVMMGGRAAEEIALGDVFTGAQNDLERATETARQMVCRFGMSARLGTATWGRPMGARFLESPVSFGEDRNFSEETARAIDGEVRALIDTEHTRARTLLSEHRAVLEAIAQKLLIDETVEGEDLIALFRREAASPYNGHDASDAPDAA